MLFFWWKKYEGSWIATQISFIGTLLVTFGSMVLTVVLGNLVEKYISNGTAINIIEIIIFAAIFITLKILLNKLTDKIATKI